MEAKKSSNHSTANDKYIDIVKVINQSYLDKGFKAKQVSDQKLIDNTVKRFSLNKEQEHAFRIVANHATNPSGEHLKMYLNGRHGKVSGDQGIDALL